MNATACWNAEDIGKYPVSITENHDALERFQNGKSLIHNYYAHWATQEKYFWHQEKNFWFTYTFDIVCHLIDDIQKEIHIYLDRDIQINPAYFIHQYIAIQLINWTAVLQWVTQSPPPLTSWLKFPAGPLIVVLCFSLLQMLMFNKKEFQIYQIKLNQSSL